MGVSRSTPNVYRSHIMSPRHDEPYYPCCGTRARFRYQKKRDYRRTCPRCHRGWVARRLTHRKLIDFIGHVRVQWTLVKGPDMLGRRPALDNDEGYKLVTMFIRPTLWQRMRERISELPGYTLRLGVDEALDLWLSQALPGDELDKLAKP